MALGLFSTLIIGTILQQIGNFIPNNIGTMIYLIGKLSASCTCAGIGVGIAYKFKESPLVTISAAVASIIGGFATKILSGQILTETGSVLLVGPGEPLGAFIAALIGIEIGHESTPDEPVKGLDFTASYENIVCRNIVTGSNYAGVFLAVESYCNDVFDNTILGSEWYAIECHSNMFNSMPNNIMDQEILNLYAR